MKIRFQLRWENWLIGFVKWSRKIGIHFGPFSLWLDW